MVRPQPCAAPKSGAQDSCAPSRVRDETNDTFREGPNPDLETPAPLNSGWWAFHRAGPERRRVDERCLGRFRRWPGAAEGLRSARLRRRPPVAVDAVLAIAGARHEPGIFRFRQNVAVARDPCHLSDFLARWTFLCLKGIRRAWGGLRMGGIATVAAAIGADLAARLPRQNKKQREGLALLVATALDVRDVNLMELAAALPRAAERLDMRYQWISRLLGNALIDTDEVIAPFAREVLARAGADGRTLVLIIDQ